MKLQQTTPGTPRIVIVGGGFGGVQLAKRLNKKPVEVLMLDKHNYHTFQPLLYQVAMGAVEADAIGFPLRRIFYKQKNFNFHLTEVTRINPESNTVTTSSMGDIKYDYLVIATGANTNFFGNKQIEHFTMPMKNIPEALNIRSLVLQNLEKAAATEDEAERKALLTFVIVGGGPTGVELAGALAEMRLHILDTDYPDLRKEHMRVYIAEGKEVLLGAFSDKASAKAKEYLTEKGVVIYNSVHVTSYDGDCVKIDNGINIKCKNVFWAAGVKGEVPDGLPSGIVVRGNRIETDEINRVKGFENIFAIGDVAASISPQYPNGHPGVAPAAMQQGQHLAKNLVALVQGKPTEPFVYHDKGSMATVGRNQAVADLGKLKFHGFVAWLLWMFVHLMSLAGFANKVIVFASWAINYITKNSDNRMIVRYFDNETMMTDPVAK